MNTSRPFVSVIIPTYRDWDRLRLCFDSLKGQTYPQDRFEVIAVNNDPEDPIPAMDLPNSFQILVEAKPGSYAARNKAIAAAKGEIFAFTDSDCIPYPDWIEKAVEKLQGGAERIAGHVELFYRSEKLTWAETYEKAFAFNQRQNAVSGVSVTANMITKMCFFKSVGLFDDSLMSGGDIEWGQRAKKMNISIVFAPEVVVKHPARYTMEQLLLKRKRVASGKTYKREIWGILRGFLPSPSTFIYLISRKDLTLSSKIRAFLFHYFIKTYITLHLIKSSLTTGKAFSELEKKRISR